MPTTPQPGTSPGEEIARTVAALARWSSRDDVRTALHAGLDLPETGWWLLHRIGGQEPVRASDLARWQGVDRSTMTTQVQRLVDAGLVSRQADPRDGRASLLRLTRAGRTATRRSTAAGAAVFDGLLEAWTPADRDEFVRLSRKFADGLDTV